MRPVSPEMARLRGPFQYRPSMATNGRRQPPRPKIEIVSGGASESEAAAIAAAIEQFLADAAPAPAPAGPPASAWQRAALEEGISARRVSAAVWGHSPAHSGQNG
jgi:hypothetical protein